MATEVKMPRLSLTMERGTIVQWLKLPGDPVAKGDALAEIETDKVNVTMDAPASGFLRAVMVAAGVEVPCETTIAVLAATVDEPLEGGPTDPVPATTAGAPPRPAGRAGSAAPSSAPGNVAAGRRHVNASPAAKTLAKELGVDLTTIAGTGPGGRIGLDDVQRAAGERAAEAETIADPRTVAGVVSTTIPLTKMRAAIAQQMAMSAATVPQFTVRRRLDMSGALRWRDAHAGDGGSAASIIDLIHLATIRALAAHPVVNGSFQAGDSPGGASITLHDGVNLGVAVALPDGLIVPVIRDAHGMSLGALATARKHLQQEATAGRLPARAIGGATFTVSNLGPMNVDDFTAIVNPPEAAILAVGRMQESLLVQDGAIRIVPMVALTVSADHRILDGAQVARFLDTLAGYLDQLEAAP
jgi:pyruvate dehydrogenase E2 component (dihydrolipoamide acetyltransferase)